MWGAVGWGGFSPIAGWIVTKYGIDTAFIVSLVTGALGTGTAWALPVHELAKKRSAPSTIEETPGRAASSSNTGPGENDPEGQHTLRQDESSACGTSLSTPTHHGVVPMTKSVTLADECPPSPSPLYSGPQGKSPDGTGHSLIRMNDSASDFYQHDADLPIVGSSQPRPREKSGDFSPAQAWQGLIPPPVAGGSAAGALCSAGTPDQYTREAILVPVRISQGGQQSSLAINIPTAAAGGDDVQWPASWPPMEAAVCGPTEHAEARSLDRIPSSFLHRVEEHIPISTVPELQVRGPPSSREPCGAVWGTFEGVWDLLFLWDPIGY